MTEGAEPRSDDRRSPSVGWQADASVVRCPSAPNDRLMSSREHPRSRKTVRSRQPFRLRPILAGPARPTQGRRHPSCGLPRRAESGLKDYRCAPPWPKAEPASRHEQAISRAKSPDRSIRGGITTHAIVVTGLLAGAASPIPLQAKPMPVPSRAIVKRLTMKGRKARDRIVSTAMKVASAAVRCRSSRT